MELIWCNVLKGFLFTFPLIFFDSEKIGQNISERIDLLKETFLFFFLIL